MFGKEYSSDNSGDGPPSEDERLANCDLDFKHDDAKIVTESLKRKRCVAVLTSSDDERSGSSEEYPEILLNPPRQKHTWVVNVGLKNNAQFSGNKLADMIMKLEKKVKYFPEAITCFDQWICLREINCDHDPGSARLPNGRIRCAIQISPIKKPLGDEWYRKEWGWDAVKNASNLNPWAGFEITKVRIFRYSVIAQQTNQGRPWTLKTDLEFANKTPQLILAIKDGIDATPAMKGKVARQRTYLRTTEREKKRAAKTAARDLVKHFEVYDNEGNVNYVCCQSKFCVVGFGCSYLDDGQQHCSYDIFQWIRNKYHKMSRIEQRAFIRNRLINKCATTLANTKKFYLEKIEILQGYMNACHLPTIPSIGEPKDAIRVCRSFFRWVLGCSKCKMDQPTKKNGMFGPDFSVEMSGPRPHCMWDAGAADCIVEWLLAFSSFHLHDPAHPQIILSVASLSQVYDCYAADFLLPGEKKYFPHDRDGMVYLPSRSYFLSVWRTNTQVTHIKVRKYHVFSMCEKCVEFVDRRRTNPNLEEKQKILKEEREHYMYIRMERLAYYAKRKLGIYFGKDYISIIIDGSSQSAYNLPHMLENDKLSSGCTKNQVYLMGALVHGRAAYCFTYLKNFLHGTNVMTECLHHVLLDIYAKDGRIPRTIYLQLDNTTKQNKSRYMIGYLGCLVEWGVVDKVVVSFLPVGHTHEDVGNYF